MFAKGTPNPGLTKDSVSIGGFNKAPN